MRGISSLGGFVRAHDRDRYQTTLFAPADRREALFALYAFNYEIARVRETVTQPMLGQIRLQWWREVIDAAFSGTPARQHEVAMPLTGVIREHRLNREHLDRLIDTRERDLADEPPTSLRALEEYAEGSSARLLYLALEVLGADEAGLREAAAEIGMAYALTGLLRAMAFHARAGRCYIPADIAAQSGLDPTDYAELRPSGALRNAAGVLADAAATHLAAARRQRRDMPRHGRAVLLQALIADGFLTRLRRAGNNPFATELAPPDPLQSWRLFAAALRGRY